MLDIHLKFNDRLRMASGKTSKTVGLLLKLQDLLLRAPLITIYKAFIRSHPHYGDALYGQAENAFFKQKLESIQYNACLGITGAIQITLKEKFYQQLGFEPLQLRHIENKKRIFEHQRTRTLVKINISCYPLTIFKNAPSQIFNWVVTNIAFLLYFGNCNNTFKIQLLIKLL